MKTIGVVQMNKSRYSMSNLKVGITVFIGLIIFIFFMFIVGSEENYFTPTYKLRMFVSDVNGLAKGSMVTLGGLKIGYVDDMEFSVKDGISGIDIVLKLKSKYADRITQNSIAEIKTIGLLGDKYVDITIGQKTEQILKEYEYLNVKKSFELTDIAVDLKEGINEFKKTTKSIQMIIDSINSGKGTIGKLIKSSEIYNEASLFIKNLNKISDALNNKKGSLGRLINDNDLYNDLKVTISEISLITKSLNKGEGSFGKLLKNDSLYIELNNTVNKVNLLLKKTESKDNVVGGLVNDEALYDDVVKTIKELNELIKEIKENPEKFFNFSIF